MRDTYINITNCIFDAMNSKDFSEPEKYMSDDIAFDFPGTDRIEGKKRVLVFLKVLTRKYKDLTFTVSEILIDGDRACAVWTNKGTGNDGEAYSNSGMTLVHFKEDKIVFMSDYFKDTSFAG